MASGDFDQHQLDNDFRQACSLGNINEVKRNIINNIVDINVADKYEQFTGLHMACEQPGHVEIVKYLLENNANVNCQNSLNETPIIIALKLDAKSSHSNKNNINFEKRNNIIELLLSYGADLELGFSKDIDSKSQPKAIHCAVILGDINIIRKLLTKNAKLISCLDAIGRYPIHYASKYNKIFAMQELMAGGSQLEVRDINGWNPFHVACNNMHIDIIQFILDAGGHMNTKTKAGDQALHIACRHKVKDIVPIVEFLINQGADQHEPDSTGKCLKHYIRENILLKNVISSAKKKNKSAFPASSSSFGVINLYGKRLYKSSGYKIDTSNKNKKLNGSITLYEHGMVFSYKKGWVSKTIVEEFHQWKPYVELIIDTNSTNLLCVEFKHKHEQNNEDIDDDKKEEIFEEEIAFGISPCRPNEIIETIQGEINKMYPTYSLQNEIKEFLNKIGGEEKGVADIIDEYNELNQNILNSIKERDEIEDKSSDTYNKLQSEINTMNARIIDIENNATIIWNESANIISNKIEPLIDHLSVKIDSMIVNNEHWKIISNVRKSLNFAKEYQDKLVNIKTQIKFIVIKENDNMYSN